MTLEGELRTKKQQYRKVICKIKFLLSNGLFGYHMLDKKDYPKHRLLLI